MSLPKMVAAVTLFGLWTSHGTLLAQQSKTAGESFKNIQVLKRVPADQWFDTMAFIAGSLGVTCDHCHSSAFETDEGNPNKLKAREMMRMVDDINNRTYGGTVVVTCNTCHRGTAMAEGAPAPNADHWKKAAEKPSIPPTAKEILARYRQSIGSIQTQAISVRVETYGGTGAARIKSAEVVLEGKAASISEQDGATTRRTKRSDEKAWIDDGKGWREMSQGETFDAFEVADVLAADQVGNVESAGEVFNDRLGELNVYVVPVKHEDERKLLFFDRDSCLLLKQRLLFSSFYGDGAVDINYKDHKKVGEGMLPATIEVVNAGGAGLIIRRVISRQVNLTLAPDEFRVPHT
jgi:hypothetical protein